MKALLSMPSDVRRVLRTVDPSAARRRPASDAKSIADWMHVLADTETHYLSQLQDMVQQEQLTLFALLPDDFGCASDIPLGELIDRFQQARAETLAFLEGLSLGDWQRKALHEAWGEMTLRYLVQRLVDHDTYCLSQLIGVRQALRSMPLAVKTDVPAESLSSATEPRPRLSTAFNTNQYSEGKNESRRARKWPRKRRRGN